MKKIVISLGGSLIIPDQIDFKFLDKLKKTLENNYQNYKFIIVCGGGAIARKYIDALKEEGKNNYEMAQAGIRATRMNAMFLMQFFGKDANSHLPLNMKEVENNINKNRVVICGALRWTPNSTSDNTAAKLAYHLKTDFLNMTNVKGLYTQDPRKFKDAKLIEKISWKEFEKTAHKVKSQPGQHFVLDQKASTLIRKHKIRTCIIGKDLKNLQNFLKEKKFKGTIIEN